MRAISQAIEAVGRLDPREVASKLTLLLLVLYGPKYWDLSVPTVILAALGLVISPLSGKWWYWLLMTLIQGMGILPRIFTVDNHKVLMVYWCLALALSCREESLLRFHSRLLIACCFVFASFWKSVTANFVDGSFLHLTFLTDDRFFSFANMVGGISDESMKANIRSLQDVLSARAPYATLLDSPALFILAKLTTIWTLFTELSIGLLFLLPTASIHVERARNVLLLSFLILTYPIATVIGFGWLLSIMGFCQCRLEQRPTRAAYLLVFVLLQVYLIPWSGIVDPKSWFGL